MVEKECETKIETKNKGNEYKIVTNIADINPAITIITLNINNLNTKIQRLRFSEQTPQKNPTICCLQETHFKYEDTCMLKVKW